MGQKASLIYLVQQGTEDAIENMILNEKSGSFDYTIVDTDGRNALHWSALTGKMPPWVLIGQVVNEFWSCFLRTFLSISMQLTAMGTQLCTLLLTETMIQW
jgi:hypothetical protein